MEATRQIGNKATRQGPPMDALGKRLALARAEEIVAAVIGGEPTERSDAALDAICRGAAARLVASADDTDYTEGKYLI